MLHLTDGERIEQVIFAALAVLILAAHDQLGFRIRERLEGVGMLHLRFASKHAEADALDARRGAGEVGLNKRFVQAHCFEDLRATITLQSTDAHLRKGLQQSLVDGLDEVLFGVLGSYLFRQQATALEIVDGFDGEIGIDGAGAVSDEERKVHHLAWLAAFDDERDLGAGFFLDQAVVYGGHGQQAGNGRVGRIDAAIGEDEKRVTRVHSVRSAGAQFVEGLLQALFAILGAEERGQRGGEQVAR